MGRALVAIWTAAGSPWSARLTALLPTWLPWARRRLALTPATETGLRRISARQIDRVLAPHKRTIRRRPYGRTKPGTLLKHHIPLRTGPELWRDEASLGNSYLWLDRPPGPGARHRLTRVRSLNRRRRYGCRPRTGGTITVAAPVNVCGPCRAGPVARAASGGPAWNDSR